uniref:Uncharacterized protein n=1 Tax=Sus scrofa TaxID=9823 RepID=A0A8D0X2U0_PIG
MCPFTQNSIWQIVEAQARQGKDTHSIFDIIGKEIQAKIVEHDRCLAFHDFPLQSGRASVSFLKMEGKKAFSSILVLSELCYRRKYNSMSWLSPLPSLFQHFPGFTGLGDLSR